MSERMTGIRLRNSKAAGSGLAEWGRKTPAHMVTRYRQYANSLIAEGQAILAAADADFHVETYTGVHVNRNREVLQEGAPREAAP